MESSCVCPLSVLCWGFVSGDNVLLTLGLLSLNIVCELFFFTVLSQSAPQPWWYFPQLVSGNCPFFPVSKARRQFLGSMKTYR